MWSGKVNRVRTGEGFLGAQSVQRENRKDIPGQGRAEAGSMLEGEEASRAAL